MPKEFRKPKHISPYIKHLIANAKRGMQVKSVGEQAKKNRVVFVKALSDDDYITLSAKTLSGNKIVHTLSRSEINDSFETALNSVISHEKL